MNDHASYYDGYMVRNTLLYFTFLDGFNLFIKYNIIVILDSPQCAMQQLLTAEQCDEL